MTYDGTVPRAGAGGGAEEDAAGRMVVHALVLDLDNTLYDWVAFFVPALYAMLDEAARLLGVPVNDLLDEITVIHQRYGNTEYPFALLETQTVARRHPGVTAMERRQRLANAFKRFDEVRGQELRLYPGVAETLATIRGTGCRVVAYTEATDTNVKPRLRQLKLLEWLERIYAPQFSGGPHPDGPPRERRPPIPIHRLGPYDRKPDDRILRRIVRDLGVPPGLCLYVGDSLDRDVAMANAAGVLSAWAEYGCVHDPVLNERLAAVSHRKPAFAGRGVEAAVVGPTPDVTLTRFADLLTHFQFASPGGRSEASSAIG